MRNPLTPSLIALDWGTSSVRALLLDEAGDVIEERTERWGVMHVPGGDFSTAYNLLTHAWLVRWPGLQAIAAGMIGSTRGWFDVPYCDLPCGVSSLASGAMRAPSAALHVVPGIAQRGERPDVMRGEETQIIGALELRPELAAQSRLVLPGTHSKWVDVRDGMITGFTTFMTGELFGVLRDHSILGRAGKEHHQAVTSGEAFARGVAVASASPRGIASALFSARSLVLTHALPPEDALSYLSGLLIGDELCAALANGRRPDGLIGDPVLCNLYVSALRQLGEANVPVIEHAARAGLWRIACDTGIVSRLTADAE